MKLKTFLIMFLTMLALAHNALAADIKSYEERATNLRLELFEVQAKEAELQVRLQQLDDEMKPENIERALAGIGSTKPEDLREHRRRLLSIERDGVRAQLKLLENTRTRLEVAITAAETAVYQQSAEPSTAAEQPGKRDEHSTNPRWFAVPPATPACKDSGNKNEPDLGRELNSAAECSSPSLP